VVTVSEMVCDFAAGAPLVLARTVKEELLAAMLLCVDRVKVTFTGELEVGCTELDGAKLQVAPAGRPTQVRATVPLKEPPPVTCRLTGLESEPLLTVIVAGEGAPNPKSITCRVTGERCVVELVSAPDPFTLKLKSPAALLPALTENATPPGVGVAVVPVQVEGTAVAAGSQEIVT